MKEEEVRKNLIDMGYNMKEVSAFIRREHKERARIKEAERTGIANRLVRDME